MAYTEDPNYCGPCPHHEAVITRLTHVESRMGMVEKFILGVLVFFASASIYTVGLVRELPQATADQIKAAVSEIRQQRIDDNSGRGSGQSQRGQTPQDY